MAAAPKQKTAWSDCFLHMLAAERGAGANTLSAYTRDLEDCSPI